MAFGAAGARFFKKLSFFLADPRPGQGSSVLEARETAAEGRGGLSSWTVRSRRGESWGE